MKTSCCLGLCLFLTGNVFSADWSHYESYSDENVANLREILQNPEKAKEFLTDEFAASHALWQSEIPLFKMKFDVQDEIIRPLLLDILRESAQKVGWETPLSWQDDSMDVIADKRRLYGAIAWLGACADEPTKKLLLDIAMDGTKDTFYREPAVWACLLYHADAQEIKNILIRYLVEANKESRLHNVIYAFAEEAYRATTDEMKREAILASFSVAVAQTKNKWAFERLDNFLTQNSKEYAESSQRKAALQQMNLQPPPEPVEKKAASWKLPLLIGILSLGGVGVAWCCFRKRRGS